MTIDQLEEQLDTIEGVLMRTEAELNAANKAANEAEANFQKAAQWNALTEVELGLLRGLCHDQEDDIKDLMTTLRELCEKMESGISGEQETKRARQLLNKLA